MLWDPGSVKKDEGDERDNVPVTPILVPLQNKPPTVEKSVPVLVPDVKDLKDQFQQQQNMLTQIKETLIQNESQLSSKGRQVEVYANKLSQIRARSKNTQGKKSIGSACPTSPKLQKKFSKENLTKPETESEKSSESNSKNRKGKVSELRKCLEENKIKFEQRTGKEQSETKKIESLVEQLKMQLEERDKTIQDLQKTIEEPTPKLETLPKQKSAKLKESVASKTTQTTRNQPTEESIEIIALQNKIHELEANVLDLEENLKEKESVIEARTQAVTLLSQDLSLKGKNTLDSLEETRQEMRTMQNNFIAIEDQLKKDLLDRNNRLTTLEEKCKKSESTNFELSLKNAELQEKLVIMQTKYLEVEKCLKDSEKTAGVPENDKLEELTKKINVLTKELDDRNKAMIKMKIEHKNKMKNLNKTLESVKGTSDDKAEIIRLNGLLHEIENIKTGLENRVAELEDEKVSEKKLKDQINELEIIIQKQNEDLTLHLKTISSLEKENFDLMQSNQEQNGLVENLKARISALETVDKDLSEKDKMLRELSQRIESMEEEHGKRLEEIKGEHKKEIELLESYHSARGGESFDRKALEEFRISTEMNNIHVEEQIELLIREKQQLLEKLKSLSGVSSTDSLTFEKMEHSDLKDEGKETILPLGEEIDLTVHRSSQENRDFHLEKIVNDQQHTITELQKAVETEREKIQTYEKKISELEGTIKRLEEINLGFKQQIEMSEATESGKNTKTNTNTKNRIKKIEMELSQSKKTIQEQSEKLEELSLKLKEKEELIEKYSERIELFEKDDWDRQNHWKNTADDIESVPELQKKCLSLENSLFELNEDCERLRKENIEIVHLLSEEKVKRRKLLEELEAKPETDKAGLEERVVRMSQVIEELENKIEKLELDHASRCQGDEGEPQKGIVSDWEIKDLHEKLEWANVVLTGKETEIFRLQNLLEDRNKSIEILQADAQELKSKLAERDKRLGEIIEELKSKESQLEEISANFDRLQESVAVANQKTATNESQLKELLATVKEMEGDVFRKETELQEIKGILAEKNLDMTNLRNRLEEVNSDLTYSYQEHLENMGKCLRDKESDYDALLAEKGHLDDVNRSLVTEKEDLHNQKMELANEKNKLQNVLLEKEKIISELKEKLQSEGEGKHGKQEIEDLKIKMKKLAANLKKKVQNETDLTKRVKELEEAALEKEKRLAELESETKEVTEKWTAEKTEKEKMAGELMAAKDMLESRLKELEAIEQGDKGKIAHLEAEIGKISQLYQDATSVRMQNQQDIETEKQSLLQKLAETTGRYEEMKFKYEQLLLVTSDLEKRLAEAQRLWEESASEKSSLDAKIQENFAVIESLEGELRKTQDQMKTVEEKFFYSEDRRMSLENKNEEMCKKIMENSENLITIDDLSVRVDELLQSEKSLQETVRNLTTGNVELKQTLDQIVTEKESLQKELKASSEKLIETSAELKELKTSDDEKNNLMRELNKEVERLKAENKQISGQFQKLNQDYEQFEVDFKENLENWQNLEKSLRHKIEELVNENASLSERLNLLSDEGHQEVKQEVEEQEKKPKKQRKSVTFRTDEVEYIKDLKNQLHKYDASLKEANEEIENLKAELFRERLRHEVSNVVAEAREKVESLRSTPEKKEPIVEMIEKSQRAPLAESPGERKFDGNVFFGTDGEDPFSVVKNPEQQSSDFDSLMWDDGWGTDGNLEAEYLAGKVTENGKTGNEHEAKIKALETEIKSLEQENERLKKEVQEQATKYAKAIKKLKEVKTAHDKLVSEAGKVKAAASGFGDLDAAIVDELKSQIESMEVKEKELLKNLENAKMEKETLLKRIDVLNAGNEKFLEMKERQDNEVEIWQRKNNELLKEIAELRQQLESPVSIGNEDESGLRTEMQNLKNKVEALEWKNCELTELLEEKQELLEGRKGETTEEKSQLRKEIEELNNVKERLERKLLEEEKKSTTTIGELNEQLTALASENETLQDILGEMKKSADAAKKDKKQEKPQESKIFDYFQTSSPEDDLFSVAKQKSEEAKEEVKILQLEELLNQKEKELNNWREIVKEIEPLRVRLTEAETKLQQKDELVNNLKIELENDKQKLREKENEGSGLRQGVFELENLIRLRDAENQSLKQELEELRHRLQEQEAAKLKDQFETIDLNQTKDKETETLRQKVVDLESLLNRREEEFELLQQTKLSEIENLTERIFQLEDNINLREQDHHRMLAETKNEIDALRQELLQVQEFARFKENEVYQLQTMKDTEIQNLNQRLFELDNMLKMNSGQERVYELENMLRYKEADIEALKQRCSELEGLLPVKDEEIGRLLTQLNELEKSYNDSKLEIERLLNEEKLNVEEKFVEPFQENMKIPVAFEVEAMTRMLEEEKQKSENFQYELVEKDNLFAMKSAEVENLNGKLMETERKLEELRKEESARAMLQEELNLVKTQMEKMISDLQEELESANLQLSVARRELEEFQNVREGAVTGLQEQLVQKETEVMKLRRELEESRKHYEAAITEARDENERKTKVIETLENQKIELESEVEALRKELELRQTEVEDLANTLDEERSQAGEMRGRLEIREAEVADLRETLTHLQEEIGHFRNFEKQVKELRVAQIKEAGSEVSVTPEGHPDLSDWTEHELAELSSRLQSDLDTALYMLHQRDVRCDELTFELMQLLEERDTLQLRLSTALRINEELRASHKPESSRLSPNLQENKDLVDQSNDRQQNKSQSASEDLRHLADKISELHSVSYLRDKRVKDDSVQRHNEQMNLLSRISDSDITLSRDVQSSPTVLLNWMRGKTTPKVMHI